MSKLRDFFGKLKDCIGELMGSLKARIQGLNLRGLRQQSIYFIVSVLVVVGLVIGGAHSFFLISAPPGGTLPPGGIPLPDEDIIIPLGTTHFTNLEAEDVTATDDLAVTDDGSIGGDLTVGGTISGGGAFTVTGRLLVDGAADEVQLTAQGYTTQTSNILVVENSSGTDLVTADNSGNVVISGTLTVSDTSALVGATTVTGAFAANGGITADTTAFSVADTTGNTIVSGTLTVSDTSTLVGVVTTTSDMVVGTDLRLNPQTAITVTTAAFAPTGSYQPISAAGWVTPTITIATAGDFLVLVNTSAFTTTIEDTGTTMLNTVWNGLQYDTLTLICDGTNWLEISRTDN